MLKLSYAAPSPSNPQGPPSAVMLRLQQVVTLLHNVDAMRQALAGDGEECMHLGRCTFLRTITAPRLCIDIRDHYFPEVDMEMPQPTRRGIRFYGLEIDDFVDILDDVKRAWPEVGDRTPCHYGDDTGAENCYNCNARIAGTPAHLRN